MPERRCPPVSRGWDVTPRTRHGARPRPAVRACGEAARPRVRAAVGARAGAAGTGPA